MTLIFMVLGLVFWFYVIRGAVRLGLRHPRQAVFLFRTARHLLRG